jgi:hypothetical protein
MSLTKVTDQSVNISSAVDEFMVKFFAALLVVMLVSFLSMGWRAGLVVAAAVPLTLAIVFVVMAATGKNFDRITLGSLTLGLGLLVDDAIIAIEMMVVKMEEGYSRVAASAYAWSHTAAPMLSGTLVTVIGLMPVGFAQSTAGEYAGNIFWIVGYALLASWVVAVVFTPYMGVKLLPTFRKIEGGHAAMYDTPNIRRQRQRYRGGHDDADAPAEAQQADDDHDGQRDEELDHELIDRRADVDGLVCDLGQAHSLRHIGVDRTDLLIDRLAQIESIPAVAHDDAQQQSGFAAIADHESRRIFIATLDCGDVRQF